MRPRTPLTIVLLLVLPGLAAGLNETPGAKTAFRGEPYAFDLPLGGLAVSTKLANQGYTVTEAIQSSATTAPEWGLDDYWGFLDDEFGFWGIFTHGNTNGHTVEAYVWSTAGQTARDRADSTYRANGFDGKIYASYVVSRGYGVGIYAAAIGGHFKSKNTIVLNGSCEGQTYQATAWPSSRVRLGWSACPLTVPTETNYLLSLMDGQNGKAKRDVANARNGLTIECDGNEATVLAPVITEIEPADGADLYGDVSGWVIFDTKMDISQNAGCIAYCDGWTQGAVFAENASWFGTNSVYYTLRPYKIGLAPFAVSSSYAMSEGGMIIDGNRDPVDSDGRGPNRDRYRVVYNSHVSNPRLEAKFDGGWAWEEPDGTHVGWITDGERGSIALDVYADDALAMTIAPAGSPDRPHYYETVTHGKVFYIRERDNDPITSDDLTRPFAISAPPDSLSAMRSLNDVVSRLSPVPLTVDDGSFDRGESSLTANFTDLVFYSSRQDFLDATLPVRQALQTKGLTSQAILGSSNPLECKARYQDIWQVAVQQHRPNPPFLIIVGEANDGSDPSKNIVGHIYLGDVGGDCYFGNNCASDALIVDADGDSLADGMFSRLNVSTLAELQNVNASALEFYNEQHISSPRALFLMGDLNWCTWVAEPVATATTIRGWYGLKGIPTNGLVDSGYSSCYDMVSRYNDAKAIINSNPGITEIAGMGYTTHRSTWPGCFFQKAGAPVFNPIDLTRLQRIIVELIGCGILDGDRSSSTQYPFIAKMLLTANPALGTTAIALLGNTRAGLSVDHLRFAEAYFDERLNGYSWSVQGAYWKAMRRVGLQDAGMRHYLLLAAAYGYPAWVPGMLTPAGVEQKLPRTTTMSLISSPNPTSGRSTIRFTLPHLTGVSVSIYDVTSRHVLELSAPKVWPAGEHSLTWDGNDSSGRPMAAGAYFIRMDADDATFSAKTIVLR